jgi:O-antigen ligase
MPPLLALLLWLVLLVGLFYFDPGRSSGVSAALWIPVVWLFILGSRLPSQWLGQHATSMAEAYQDGNPIDRTISLTFITLALAVLMSRSFRWRVLFARNWSLTVFLVYALMSVCWSDLPFITFKKWFRDIGYYFGIFLVLSDPHPLEAIRTLLRRLAYLLVPLSIVLIKYFPEMAKQYDSWTGVATFSGAATSKNTLGTMCLISGIFFFWDTVVRWRERRAKKTKAILFVNLIFLGMTIWLLNICDSATSRVCLVLGCLVIFVAHTRWSRHHPNVLKTIVPSCFCVYLILSLGFNVTGQLAGAVGRDPTLTDRTKIWAMLLNMHTNPLIGTGYESFWLGSRLDWVWRQGFGTINEAHNGYLEVYLNLGCGGLLLLVLIIMSNYGNICRTLRTNLTLGSLGLAIWTMMLFHSVTEADFRSGLMWLIFLLTGLTFPVYTSRKVSRSSTRGDLYLEELHTLHSESVG